MNIFGRRADFWKRDFDKYDFDVAKEGSYTDWFFRRLPVYYKMNDTYKDGSDRGLLERYLSAFDPEVLNVMFPDIEDYLDNINAQTCKAKFLTHISDVLGNPPDIFDNENKYRNLLAYIVSVYKIKGSKEAYELFFDILGFTVEIDEVPILNKNSLYDNQGEYDSSEFDSTYDKGRCQTCSYYDITLYYKDPNILTVDQAIINNIREAIVFNEPINAKLRKLTIGFTLVDNINIHIEDTELQTELIIPPKYDIGLSYDDGLTYEQ